MTRDEKWGYAWYAMERLYKRLRGAEGARKMLNEQGNFAKHPSKVLFSLFNGIQQECLIKKVSIDPVLETISAFDVSEFNDEPIKGMYLYTYMIMCAAEDKTVGERISSMRSKRSLSQQALADKIGVTQKDISRWENGERNPNADSQAKLAEALDCSVCMFTYPKIRAKSEEEKS